MYFTKGKQRAFELLMQQKPGFDRYQSGWPEMMKIAALAVSTAPGGNMSFAFSKSVLLPRQKDAENARQHGQIDGQKPLCHAALQTRNGKGHIAIPKQPKTAF
mgnify:CR=1 FL=1